jgi:hypothetical protein
MMAAQVGISASAVRRIWKAHGLQPHRWRNFKLSNDPQFVDKLRDVVGLYVDPPAHAIVLSLDEKSQIQALDRSQPGLPMKKGRLGTMTHDLYGDFEVKVLSRLRDPFLFQPIGAGEQQLLRDDLRGARRLAQSFAPHTCIRKVHRTWTMMQ